MFLHRLSIVKLGHRERLLSLAKIESLYRLIREAQVLSTLGANSGYLQIRVDKEEREKSEFTSDHDLCMFISMPSGLEKAPATLERVMDVMWSKFWLKYGLVDLDDIVIFSKTPKDHIERTQSVLRLLKGAVAALEV